MREFTIRSVAEFVELLHDLGSQPEHPTSFRGQTTSCALYPTLTRPGGPAAGASREGLVHAEQKLLDEFRRRVPKQDFERSDYWETAILGRHHGLPTRLLDWTELPIIALFFAVTLAPDEAPRDSGASEPQGLVFGTHGERFFMHELAERVGAAPWELKDEEPKLFIPDFRDERIFPQRSVLSVWRDPTQPFEKVSSAVWRFDVPADCHRQIRRELDGLGISAELLFPDLDGAARYLTWKATEEEWARRRTRSSR
ncbi:MAG: FRG domain-containing protein [Candidatus Binatia bacterium]